jgi:hypothetical protein
MLAKVAAPACGIATIDIRTSGAMTATGRAEGSCGAMAERTAPDTLPPRVSILVVSYNTRQQTLDCLRSVVAETRAVPYEIIVVDNASTDGSAAAIAAAFPDVTLIALNENIGFARGTNLAAEHARAPHLLLLNPDTIVLDEAIYRLWSFALSTSYAGIWGSQTFRLDGTLDPTSCFRRMTMWGQFCQATGLSSLLPRSRIFNSEIYGGWKRDHMRHVDVIAGCYLMITRSLWQQLRGFDPLFFMYGEEQDLCLRARLYGARPLFMPEAPIIHIGGASEATRAGKMVKLLAAKASLIQRHFLPKAVKPGLFLLRLWPLSRRIATEIRALIRPTASNRAEAEAWRTIWQQRAEWKNGFSPVATFAEAPTETVLAAPSAGSR